MATLCGWASIDENGKARGGAAGDQTGREVKTGNWYDFGQTVVLRFKDREKAKKAAANMKILCNGNYVGYDQNQRTTLYAELEKVGWDVSKLKTKCETDCSTMMSPVLRTVGIKVSKDIYTGNMVNAIMNTGEFEKLTMSKYTNSGDYLMTGDISVNEGRHTIMALEDGSNVAPSGSGTASGATSSGGSFQSNVKDFQKWLNATYPNTIKNNCGALLAEDNDFGSKTRAAALCAWKYEMNKLKVGYTFDLKNSNFGATCKKYGGKAVVKKGSKGRFVCIAQGMLREKGYYTGELDGDAGSKTDSAIRAYQSTNGLTVDGSCGANTWYKLFN